MTLTPEQFNLLATKDDIQAVKEDLRGDINKILTAVDGIAKKYEIFEEELTSNMAAHDRFQADITALQKRAGLKPLEA